MFLYNRRFKNTQIHKNRCIFTCPKGYLGISENNNNGAWVRLTVVWWTENNTKLWVIWGSNNMNIKSSDIHLFPHYEVTFSNYWIPTEAAFSGSAFWPRRAAVSALDSAAVAGRAGVGGAWGLHRGEMLPGPGVLGVRFCFIKHWQWPQASLRTSLNSRSQLCEWRQW